MADISISSEEYGEWPAAPMVDPRAAKADQLIHGMAKIVAVVGPVMLGTYYDSTGEYTAGILILIVVTIMATVCFWFAGPPKKRPTDVANASSPI